MSSGLFQQGLLFGCFKGVSRSVKVLVSGIEAVVLRTLNVQARTYKRGSVQ